MARIPRDRSLDVSLALLSEGYDFMGGRRRRFGSDAFRARLMGRRTVFVSGRDAARMFYEPDRFTRNGALPSFVLKLLQDEGSVATLDGAAHRRRKAMFMSLMTPERLDAMARLAADGLRSRAASWPPGAVARLHDEFRLVLCRAVCAWAGVPGDEAEIERLAGELGAMIDNAGRVGPKNWIARARRLRTEHAMRRRVRDVRAGRLRPGEETALHVIAHARSEKGELLPVEVCAVEVLNVLRPTVAIARFLTFAALALHERPQDRGRLASDDAYLESFVQETRRLAPFFPAVAGVARNAFEWRGERFDQGARFILDLYGTNRDARLWEEPERFRPERFLAWEGDAFSLIPQGGGDFHANHRCAGEWLTIAVMKAVLRVLARDVPLEIPPQDLSVDRGEMPALPESGFKARKIRTAH